MAAFRLVVENRRKPLGGADAAGKPNIHWFTREYAAQVPLAGADFKEWLEITGTPASETQARGLHRDW